MGIIQSIASFFRNHANKCRGCGHQLQPAQQFTCSAECDEYAATMDAHR